MAALKTIVLIALLMTLSGCLTPEPGSAEYDRYLRSKASREATLYQGL